ncbi:cation diffusion facilitator family transporter [Actinotalea fermentans]|uniref:Transporter n=1 Tax=Actinotalea fermentans TaxID=43671 RepID=A0A511Z1Q0_9CELL|nr:cation diffusion facilitator family transporter [Actinotalea fermentans]KGM15605.1 transporter [Actinotalea fermentans ATCC 43279 = JCM 9966 = DSM 3133]GEN81363.1 transporter [Actinotalea fermentans]
MSDRSQGTGPAHDEHVKLARYMWLSLVAALITMGLKALAALITGSVGFLSDALESGVNLVAAIVAIIALRVAEKPPDHNHDFGHGKAEYLSALVEGTMIFVAAAAIVWTSVDRLIHPVAIERAGIGLVLTTGASLINLAVGLLLVRVGTRHRSITLIADGKHLLTDVWTSAGVLVGMVLVAVTGWAPLDPIVALAVGVNILVTGYGLARRSLAGLLSARLPAADLELVDGVLAQFREEGVEVRSVRSVESGRQRLVALEIAVPGTWTVHEAHELSDRLEAAMAAALPRCVTLVHVEPHAQDAPA